MKPILLIALFVASCDSGTVNYDVRIGALDPARCTGYMQLDGDSGYWRCEFVGGKAIRDETTDVVFLNLETTPGFFSQVRGTYNDGAITGQILIDGESVAFQAVPQ